MNINKKSFLIFLFAFLLAGMYAYRNIKTRTDGNIDDRWTPENPS